MNQNLPDSFSDLKCPGRKAQFAVFSGPSLIQSSCCKPFYEPCAEFKLPPLSKSTAFRLFSAAILKYSYSAVFPRSSPAKAAFITGIRKTAFGACFPPCSTRRCRKRSSKSRSFCALIISRFGMSPPNAAYAVRRTAVFRPSPQTILLRSSVQRKSKPFF